MQKTVTQESHLLTSTIYLLCWSGVAHLAVNEVEVHEETIALVLFNVGDEGLALREPLTAHVARVTPTPLGGCSSAVSGTCNGT